MKDFFFKLLCKIKILLKYKDHYNEAHSNYVIGFKKIQTILKILKLVVAARKSV